MDVEPNLAGVSLALSQPSRCAILLALMGGVALPASELAYRAGITCQTASAHLKLLTETGLITATRSGRHRYYELTSPLVAELVETLSILAPKKPRESKKVGTTPLREARLCYDHLAGELGVRITNAMISNKVIVRDGTKFQLLPRGKKFLNGIGVDIEQAHKTRRSFARACIDWSERQPHLAGALGAAISARFFDLQWLAKNPDDRSVRLTISGAQEMGRIFGIATSDFLCHPE